ncbi:MAG: NAD(P)H-hydrate dehydratase [Gammaproteobacteria bacterium]
MDLYRAEQVRRLDATAIETFGIPGMTLMERAGRAAWELLRKVMPGTGRIAVVCGAGNNAGDGYVVARLAAEAGLGVRLVAMKPPEQLSGDALTAARAWLEPGNSVESWSGGGFQDADLIVDALLGTGLDREVTGAFRDVIDAVNASGRPVLALDIPSGLHADSGNVMGAAVKATHTMTFIGMKQGMVTGDGPEFCGQLHFNDLAVPDGVYEEFPAACRLITYNTQKQLLGRRPRNAHKGHYGHVLVVGGDYGFAGAVRMAGEAAARCGAGLTSIATRSEHAFNIAASRPELMARGVGGATDVAALLNASTVVAVGPGLGRSDWSLALFGRVLDSGRPLVVDADGLNLLAQEPEQRDSWILTPHPGEAARLLGVTAAEIQADRFAAARELQQQYGGIIALKGSGTLIAAPGGIRICGDGNPGMASGGMGDVLTGVIAGLLAQGLEASAAASLGVCLHAAAADRAAASGGERGLLATDLYPALRTLVNP